MSPIIAALYLLCILLLVGLAVFVAWENPRGAANRYFALLSLAFLGWVASLFAFQLQTSPSQQLLLLGRFNFASAAFISPILYLFVRQIAGRPTPHRAWVWIESLVVGAASLFSGAVDRQELVSRGLHTTVYGSAFPVYIVHLVAYIVGAVYVALRPRTVANTETRSQLRLIAGGTICTSVVAIWTNVFLPYAFGDFSLIHVGTVSTILFLAAVGYAIFAHGLFNVHVVIRATFVYGGLIALALEFYHTALSFLAHLLPFGNPTDRSFAAAFLTLVIYSFTQGPIQKWLEDFARMASRRLTARR